MKVTKLIIRNQMKSGNKTSRISTSGMDKVSTPLHSHQKQVCGLHGLLVVFFLLTAIHMNIISVGTMPGWRYQATLNSPSNAIRRESTLTDCRLELTRNEGEGYRPMWTRPQQTHGNLRNYTGRRRHFTACIQPDPSYTLVTHCDPE